MKADTIRAVADAEAADMPEPKIVNKKTHPMKADTIRAVADAEAANMPEPKIVNNKTHPMKADTIPAVADAPPAKIQEKAPQASGQPSMKIPQSAKSDGINATKKV